MNILIAPDSFKESMSAEEAAAAIAAGITRVLPQAHCRCLPMADGGEGTAQTLLAACGGHRRYCRVQSPLGEPVTAKYVVLDDGRAVIEMAEAAGLHLLPPEKRNPLITSTYGVGELLADALAQGCRQIIMALGGSATNDAGSGFLTALGWRFYDADGQILPPGGAALANLHHIDAGQCLPALSECRITVACDVDNPLCGATGASAVFGPQKGADVGQVARLDAALAQFARISARHLGRDDSTAPGSGAAGGMGFALRSFLQAQAVPGVALVAEAVGLEQAVAQADWVITGEGRLDGQTGSGKVPYGVLQCAQRHQVPVFALAGVLGGAMAEEIINPLGFTAVFPCIVEQGTTQEALAKGAFNLTRLAANLAAVWQTAAAYRASGTTQARQD